MFHLTTVDSATYCLLKELFTISYINNQFALADGTSLSLQIGHRHSIDLDLFSTSPFIIEELKNNLANHKNFEFELVGENSRMLFVNLNGVKCDFVQEPAKLLLPFRKMEDISLFTVEDIAAMKLHTICGRGKKKDFFDIYSLLKLYKWEDLLLWFKKKYSSSQFYFLWRSINYFEDAERNPDIKGFPPFTASWNEIKQFIHKTCVSQ